MYAVTITFSNCSYPPNICNQLPQDGVKRNTLELGSKGPLFPEKKCYLIGIFSPNLILGFMPWTPLVIPIRFISFATIRIINRRAAGSLDAFAGGNGDDSGNYFVGFHRTFDTSF